MLVPGGYGNGWENASLAGGASCRFQCSRGGTKAEGQRRAIANILAQPGHMFPWPSLGRTKGICLDLEYKPVWNLEMPRKVHPRMCWRMWRLCTNLLFYKWVKGLSTPTSICGIHILSGRKLPNPRPAAHSARDLQNLL